MFTAPWPGDVDVPVAAVGVIVVGVIVVGVETIDRLRMELGGALDPVAPVL
ncbi:MAG: hypothetical protein FWC87_01565 [Acidimicrobiaceae bacterium]|nr:hypothetical protein [Acidimicrobiaceae bacterium]